MINFAHALFIAHCNRDDEKDEAQRHSDSSDDVNETPYLSRYRGLPFLHLHDRVGDMPDCLKKSD